MNLRTLKKLSKRAAPLLRQLGDERLQFSAGRDDSYGAASFIGDRKHWDRGPCHACYEPRNDWSIKAGAEIVRVTRAGQRVLIKPPVHPRKGTPMVGATTGYYEPEWDEETAWDALDTIVRHHFIDWSEDGPTPLRIFRNPKEILDGASEIIAASDLMKNHGGLDRQARNPAGLPDSSGDLASAGGIAGVDIIDHRRQVGMPRDANTSPSNEGAGTLSRDDLTTKGE